MNYRHMEFYVDPETIELIRIDDFESRKETKNLDKNELRKYRENEKREKLDNKRSKKSTRQEINELKEILSNKMKNHQYKLSD